jgi:hypothetical protein
MDRREKNILLVSLENLDHGMEHNYYCSNDEGDPKFCDGILSAEVTTKYILSKVAVDEIVVIGSGATYDEGDDLRKICLRDGEEFFASDIHSLSEYSLYRYRIFEYLEGLDLEEHEMLENIRPEERERLVSLFNAFHREVGQRNPRLKKKDVFFSRVNREPELFEELVGRLPEDLRNKGVWLKRYMYSLLSDFYKLRALEDNEDVLVSFVPTTTRKEGSIDTQNITRIIELVTGGEEEFVNLYVDMQGLERTDDFTMVTVLSILKNEWKNKLRIQAVLSTASYGFAREIRNEHTRYELNNLLAGMNAFIQYGKVGSLREYWDALDAYDDHVERLFFAMQYIDDGVSLCNIADLEYGIKELRKVLAEERTGEEKRLESNVITILEAGIRRDFGPLLAGDKEDEVDVLELIKWTYRKEFYQQTLTLVESRIPDDFVKRGVLYYAENDRDIDRAFDVLKKAYGRTHPKERYQFNNINHYFIKTYGRNDINYRQDPAKVYQDYSKARVALVGVDDPAHLRAYSLLEDKTVLEELLFSYYNIGRIRNQVSHGDSGVSIYPGQRKSRNVNVNVRMLREAVEYFIQRYDVAKEQMRDKTATPRMISNEELKESFFRQKANRKVKRH